MVIVYDLCALLVYDCAYLIKFGVGLCMVCGYSFAVIFYPNRLFFNIWCTCLLCLCVEVLMRCSYFMDVMFFKPSRAYARKERGIFYVYISL